MLSLHCVGSEAFCFAGLDDDSDWGKWSGLINDQDGVWMGCEMAMVFIAEGMTQLSARDGLAF